MKTVMMIALCMMMAACGKAGKDGANGTNGVNGSNGSDGSNGHDGTPGTVINMIKLCPGVTVYPSAFVEVAVCVDNKLYGVYSANGGFMTELVSGAYSSNAIGSACNLTVGANCAVTY